MPYTVRLEGDVFWTTMTGTFTNEDLMALARTAAELEAPFAHVPNRIADFSGVRELRLDFSGVNAYAAERTARRYPNDFKTALVAPDLIHFGFARMFQTLVEHTQIRVAIFPTVGRALQWLSEPGLDLPKVQWAPRPVTPISLVR